MNASRPVAGIILAGGRSRRMGVDKATLDWHGQPLLNHVVKVLAPQVSPLVLAVKPDQDGTDLLLPAVTICPDETSYQGPLLAFQHAQLLVPRSCPVFLTGCDYPCLSGDIVETLHSRLGTFDAVVPRVGGHAHPLLAVYQPSIRLALDAVIKAGKQSMKALLDVLEVRWIDDEEWATLDPHQTILRNVNTPEDYADALEACGPGHATRGPAAP
jgi:molybdopterin-guanine dinucleotide biosynthesis protein A